MKTSRRAITIASFAAISCGIAGAGTATIPYRSTPVVFGPFSVDFAYSLSLPDFDPSLGTLTGATIYFYGQTDITTLTLVNSSSIPLSFEFISTANITSLSTNSANSADAFNGETLTLFDQSMTLAGQPPTVVCPTATPSATCNTVTFADTGSGIPAIEGSNLGLALPTGTGTLGVDGVVMSIVGADLANYTGTGSFTLGGQVRMQNSFVGGGNQISPIVNEFAQLSAEIDYTYTTPSGAPEPATVALLGAALLALDLKRRRFIRK